MPKGGAQASSLAVELTAGGLKPEHTKHVLNKFNRESRGVIDFLDFVTYVPLFVEIHKRIISDPLRQELDL
ncbi:mucin-5ac-like isoform x4 [Plakobranchus ocellatus]|uniref:Mucin-5ac-like isoform x4 n=1 Tax=Plakobranchus ocellatus TaxID=259542 RepID=A0AAV4CZK7_9GAST|nr:mucin-5ac-like isoform x4 [Plakobranchus ocellatus]